MSITDSGSVQSTSNRSPGGNVFRAFYLGQGSLFFGHPNPLFQLRTNYSNKQHFHNTSPHLALSYKISDLISAYATYSEGYKSGGFDMRGDAFLTAGPQGVYISRVNPKVALVKGEVPNVQRQPAGIALEKGNAALRKAIALALVSAMEDGSYKAILDEFGVASSAVSIDLVRKAVE